MKVAEHVEHLLRQGKKPKELVELGFSKQVVTRVRRQLREEKAAQQVKVARSTESFSVEDLESYLDGIPALGLRHRFKCDCGASGFVAVRIECTKCGRETWWGWFPNQ